MGRLRMILFLVLTLAVPNTALKFKGNGCIDLDGFDTPASCIPFETLGADVCKGEVEGRGGGEWSACTHLKIYGINHGPGFQRFLAYQLEPRTALEFGCGLGAHSDFVRRVAGTDVTCIEPENTLAPMMAHMHGCPDGEPCVRKPGAFQQLALDIFADNESTQACTRDLSPKKYDLVMSLEVAEHISLKNHESMIRFLARSTGKWFVFSAARPDQGGTGHLPESMFHSHVWRKIWEEAGLVFMPRLTKMAADSAWFGRQYDITGNVLVFKSADNSAIDTDVMDERYNHFFYAQGCNTNLYARQGGGPFEDSCPYSMSWFDGPAWAKFVAFQKSEQQSLWPEIYHESEQARTGEIQCVGNA